MDATSCYRACAHRTIRKPPKHMDNFVWPTPTRAEQRPAAEEGASPFLRSCSLFLKKHFAEAA